MVLSEPINTSTIAVYEDIITRISCNLVGANFSIRMQNKLLKNLHHFKIIPDEQRGFLGYLVRELELVFTKRKKG